eukprot:COSAG01_NODE_229_length_21089_cov_575.019194_29_plen_129_part_00
MVIWGSSHETAGSVTYDHFAVLTFGQRRALLVRPWQCRHAAARGHAAPAPTVLAIGSVRAQPIGIVGSAAYPCVLLPPHRRRCSGGGACCRWRWWGRYQVPLTVVVGLFGGGCAYVTLAKEVPPNIFQ